MSMEAVWPKTPEDYPAAVEYYSTHIRAATKGETVWIQRNFDSDGGRVLDLFAEGKFRGFIHQDFDLGVNSESLSCTAYVNTDPEEGPEPVIRRDLTLAEASRVLLEEVFPTESD